MEVRILGQDALDECLLSIRDETVRRHREMSQAVPPERRRDLGEIRAQERLSPAEGHPQERTRARERVGEAADVGERRSGDACRDFLPVEAVTAAQIALPRDEQREVDGWTATSDDPLGEREIPQRVQARFRDPRPPTRPASC